MINKEVDIEFINKNLLKNNITFVTGSFDILHPGHINFLAQAKNIEPQNKLLVAVLSDDQIKRRKGESRPIFPQDARITSLSNLEVVDYVLAWRQKWEALREFVVKLSPKILVVGENDPGIENKRKIMQSLGGQVHELQRKNKYSTTYILKKLSQTI